MIIHRGINPENIKLSDALSYKENRGDIIEEQKNIWKEAAADLFGEK